ncbi:MAG: copper chaperone PCu(A)C [Allosphingosinicella sp.]
MSPLIPLATALIAPAILLAGCDGRSTGSTVAVRNPVIRLSAAPEGPAAGYLTLSASPDHVALVSVSSPKAAKIEMHETMSSGSMTSMRPLARIDVRYGEIVFASGGRHLMLFGVDPAIKPGDEIPLVLQFSNKGVAAVNARVIGPGDEVPN